ncbi:S41 family peptidase [Salimicrobium halophilum]|uniref:C-terminal processing peptidase n=1 Tax=Salimicrobium halophilum TaxID=86666 RepID=A0A1G8V6P6_9BACI|nr:S41 family peptidase [Salimicrobium halophilum]SDJ60830.1 carboxyl-terminal processing protease [Salimicrobium halophilum]
MNWKGRHVIVLVLVALLVGAGGSYAGMQWFGPGDTATSTSNSASSEEGNFGDLSEEEQKSFLESVQGSSNLKKVEQAYSIISDRYVEDVEKSELVEGAIEGMVEKLEDPYSTYMDQETMSQFNQSIESSFQGIGAEVSMVDDTVTIVAPIKGAPAEEAGLKPNDQVMKIDGESTEGLDLQEAVNKIRGEKGTDVTLTVERPGAPDLIDITITRDEIPKKSVYKDTKEVDGKKVGVLEITSFSEETSKEFDKALTELENEGMEGLVIDVRGNPGGLFTDVQDILKTLLPGDKPIVQIENRAGEVSKEFSERETGKEYPISVLIDEGSASASEILAAAMKEIGNHPIVGEKSFGKGTVQQAVPMGDGSTLKLTMFKWLTPEGNWIHEKGVSPTVEVKQPEFFYTHPITVEDTFGVGASGDHVKNAQQMLAGLGYDQTETDGSFGDGTEAAVESFQRANGLSVTGEINEKTGGALEEKVVEEVQKEENDKQMQKAVDVLFSS